MRSFLAFYFNFINTVSKILILINVLGAVRLTDETITEREMINFISKWLVQATLRYERSLEPKNT